MYTWKEVDNGITEQSNVMGDISKSIMSPKEQGAWQLELDHVDCCGLVCFWISERHLL